MVILSILSFVIELVALVAYGYLPFVLYPVLPFLLNGVLSVVLVSVFIALWARFAAPRSLQRLGRLPLLIFKLTVLLPALGTPLVAYGVEVGLLGTIIIIGTALREYQVAGRKNDEGDQKN